MKVALNIQIHFDIDRPNVILTEAWIKERFQRFLKFTHSSIKRQSFDEYQILMFCGDRNKELVDALPWPSDITIVRGFGKDYFPRLQTDYLAIFRIDSDDLLHQEALDEIADNLRGRSDLYYQARHRNMIFRNNIQWNIPNKFIKPHVRVAPPFVCGVYPKKLFQDHDYFFKHRFCEHGSLGGRDPDCIELSRGKVCVVKHLQNISLVKKGLTMPILTQEQKEYERANSEGNFYTDPVKMAEILKPFGVDYEEYR